MQDDKEQTTNHISITYKNSAYLRTVQADGATGGFTQPGKFMIVFYSEQFPVPDRTVHEINEDGNLGPPKEITPEFGIVREKEVVVSLGIQQVGELSRWLQAKINEYQKQIEEISNDDDEIN